MDVMSSLSGMLADAVSHLCGADRRDTGGLYYNGGRSASEGIVGGGVQGGGVVDIARAGGGAIDETGGRGIEGVEGGAGGGADGETKSQRTVDGADKGQVHDILCQGLHLLKLIR